MKNIFFIIVIVFFSSCDRQIIIDLGTPPRRLVMSCTLDADSLVNIHVNRSVSSLDRTGPISVTNAKVELYENDVLLETLNNGNAGYYLFSVKPEPGKNYRVNCSYENYESITAQTTLPFPVEIVSTTIDTIGIVTQFGETVNLKLTINDPANESNYYMIKLMYRDTLNFYNYPVYLISADPLFNQTDEFVFDDITFNGKQRTFTFSMDKPEFQFQPIGNYVFELHHLNYDAYQFVVTFNRYMNNYSNPFAEPIQVYSNVSSQMGQLSGRALSSKPLSP